MILEAKIISLDYFCASLITLTKCTQNVVIIVGKKTSQNPYPTHMHTVTLTAYLPKVNCNGALQLLKPDLYLILNTLRVWSTKVNSI